MNRKDRFAKYFTLEEMCKSNTASKLGINNTPGEEELENLKNLVSHVLDPVREMLGKPIIVNSGYRSEKLNKAVGGAKNSQHLYGRAADIQTVGDKYNKELFELCKTMDFDQIIWEFGNDDCPDWVHISYVSSSENRHQILKAVRERKKTLYLPL